MEVGHFSVLSLINLKMPRESKRKKFIRGLKKVIANCSRIALLRFLMDMEDESDDEIDMIYRMRLRRAEKSRYLFRSLENRSHRHSWRYLLYNDVMVNETEFLSLFRMSRECFWNILDIVNTTEDAVTLKEMELLTLLKFLGGSGTDSTLSKISISFGIGLGSVQNYIEKALDAVLKLRSKTVFWPANEERDIISSRMKEKFDFINCIGIIDGTLIPLEFKPQLDGEDYFTRKGGYAVHSLIICDDVGRIRGITLGWAGSVHDNRIWNRCNYNTSHNTYFREHEYLLGDSAFKSSNIMVPAFKKPFGTNLDDYKSFFNTKLAKPRVKSEHCIGWLKGRFQLMKRIRNYIRCRRDMIRINRLITASVIFHNLMINEPFPEEWIHADGGTDEEEESDELNMARQELNEASEAETDGRRQSLFNYMCLMHR